VSATNAASTGKRGKICVGNNVSAKMCPRLPGPLLEVKNFANGLKTTQTNSETGWHKQIHLQANLPQRLSRFYICIAIGNWLQVK